MNILQVSHSFYPCYQAGGVVKVVYDLSRFLVKRGHRVTVVTTDGCIKRLDVQKNCEVNLEGVKVWYFRNISNYLRIKFKFATPYLLPFFMRKQIHNFDIIHIHEYQTILAIIVCLFAQRNKMPYVVQTHGSVLPEFQFVVMKKIFNFFWGNQILHNAEKVIALNQTEQNQLVTLGVPTEKIVIIPNGIDSDLFLQILPQGAFRKKYHIDEKQKIILFLGRIDQIKGLDLLIDSYIHVKTSISNTLLVIVGPDTGYLSVIKEMIIKNDLQNDILLPGPLYELEKFEAYQDANVFILPSIIEVFPVSVIEAWAFGLPVIISDTCQLSNVVIDHNAGLVVRREPLTMKNAIITLLTNEEASKKYGENGKNLVESHFSWDIIIPKFEEVYTNILNG